MKRARDRETRAVDLELATIERACASAVMGAARRGTARHGVVYRLGEYTAKNDNLHSWFRVSGFSVFVSFR